MRKDNLANRLRSNGLRVRGMTICGYREDPQSWVEEEILEGHTSWVSDVAWARLPRSYNIATAYQDILDGSVNTTIQLLLPLRLSRFNTASPFKAANASGGGGSPRRHAPCLRKRKSSTQATPRSDNSASDSPPTLTLAMRPL
ncbi:hypothetical protein F5887DRAFT_929799 [Amanita rubescens]|nr:hypothetical protein F5887DRAFT_929799 [Amanita rubescens]